MTRRELKELKDKRMQNVFDQYFLAKWFADGGNIPIKDIPGRIKRAIRCAYRAGIRDEKRRAELERGTT